MEQVVASVNDDVIFDIEKDINDQVGILPLHFDKMDKSKAAICNFYNKGLCNYGKLCSFRHVKINRSVVCKHWLRGLCKTGDDCEFLHVYDTTKMPECYFFSKFNSCTNKECMFLHLDPNQNVKECPWYNRGFCKWGLNCRLKHIRRRLCCNYICGFCPHGKGCQFYHGKFYVDLEKFKKLIN